MLAAVLEGNLYYGKTKGPRKSHLLPWQPSAFLEQWEKGEGKEKANNTLMCRNFSSRWDILLNQGRICGWWWRARGLFPGTKPKVDFTSFSEVRVNWGYQRRGLKESKRGECQLCSSLGSRNGTYGGWRSRCPFLGSGEKVAAKEVPGCNSEDPGSSDPSSNLVEPF